MSGNCPPRWVHRYQRAKYSRNGVWHLSTDLNNVLLTFNILINSMQIVLNVPLIIMTVMASQMIILCLTSCSDFQQRNITGPLWGKSACNPHVGFLHKGPVILEAPAITKQISVKHKICVEYYISVYLFQYISKECIRRLQKFDCHIAAYQ